MTSAAKRFWMLLIIFIVFYFSILFNLKALLQMPLLNVFLGVPPDELRDYWTNSADIIWDVPISEKIIALTFDDGPDPVFTPKVLDILQKNHANGTFFVLGEQVEQYPDVAKMIVDQGNEIANHTYTHPHTKGTSIAKLEKEMLKTHTIILGATHTVPTLFRPPEGYFNKKIVALAKENGYRVILWSWTQDTRDWANPGVKAIINKVLKNAKSGDIVIFHDCGGDRSQTIKALGPVIEGLKEKGFELVTVSQLLDKWDKAKNLHQKASE